MKLIALNGSPRKGWNTEQLLQKTMDGARSLGADTELIQLYGQEYKGCVSCFACKVKGSKTNGLCAHRDALRPILEKCLEADAIVIGSPVYFDYPTAQTRAFLERFLFPLDTYMVKDGVRQKVLDKVIPSAFIFTMNCPEDFMDQADYTTILAHNEGNTKRLLGYCETLYSCDTYQYKDYSKMDCDMFDEKKKAQHKEEQFPIDLETAYELGKRLIQKVIENNGKN
jgi:multimeric flavodoxin WrbA